MPFVVTCQVRAMKHESMVFQFQSICYVFRKRSLLALLGDGGGGGMARTEILQLPPMEPWEEAAAALVAAGMAVPVGVADMPVMAMSPWSCPISILKGLLVRR